MIDQISNVLSDIWNGIAWTWQEGIGNATPTIFDPVTGQMINDPLIGVKSPWLGMAKIGLIGWLGLAIYSEIKSPTKKTKRKRWKAGRFSVG
jgi:hypothetical protein